MKILFRILLAYAYIVTKSRRIFHSKMKRKTCFPFEFCSLIRNFAGKTILDYAKSNRNR